MQGKSEIGPADDRVPVFKAELTVLTGRRPAMITLHVPGIGVADTQPCAGQLR